MLFNLHAPDNKYYRYKNILQMFEINGKMHFQN